MNEERKIVELDLDDILPNRFQPRIKFNEESILELSESIKEHGVIQPIVVRKIGSTKYEIIAGERRYKASVLAGKKTIPAIVTELNDKDSVEIALIENVQRENLTPIEEAVSYRKILDMGYIKQEQLADKLGKTQSTIANKLRLLNLSEDVQEALLENRISERHARSLLKFKNEKDQISMLNRIIEERLTVRKADEEIDKMLNSNEAEVLDININPEPVVIGPMPQAFPSSSTIEISPIEPVDSIQETPVINDVKIDIPTAQEEFPTFIPSTSVPEMTIEEIIPSVTTEQSVFSPALNPVEEPIIMPEEEILVPPTQIDVDKIAEQATDLYIEKPVADMESLLQSIPNVPNEPIIEPIIEPIVEPIIEPIIEPASLHLQTEIPIPLVEEPLIPQQIEESTLQPGRFFNLFDSSTEETEEDAGGTSESMFNNTKEVPSEYESIINPVTEPTENIIPIGNNEPVIEPVIPTTNFGMEHQNTFITIPVTEDISVPNPQMNIMQPTFETPTAEETKIDLMAPPVPTLEPHEIIANTPEELIIEPLPEREVIADAPYKATEPMIPIMETPSIPSFINNDAIYEPLNEVSSTPQAEAITSFSNTMDAINIIRNCAKELENRGFNIDTDEFDLENMYQFIIKVEK